MTPAERSVALQHLSNEELGRQMVEKAAPRPKIIAIGASPNGHFALMDDGRLFERIRDNKHFDGRNPDKWIWIERDGPLTPKAE